MGTLVVEKNALVFIFGYKLIFVLIFSHTGRQSLQVDDLPWRYRQAVQLFCSLLGRNESTRLQLLHPFLSVLGHTVLALISVKSVNSTDKPGGKLVKKQVVCHFASWISSPRGQINTKVNDAVRYEDQAKALPSSTIKPWHLVLANYLS